MTDRCERTDLLVDQCAHCRGHDQKPVTDWAAIRVHHSMSANFYGRCALDPDHRIAEGDWISRTDEVSTYLAGGVVLPPGYIPPSALLRPSCPSPVEVTRLDRATPEHVCGCGECGHDMPRPVPCICGHLGTHRPEPGIGCTRPGCLCLEPAEPTPRPPAPPDRSWIQMERIR